MKTAKYSNKFDNRRSYRKIKIMILELWFRFSYLGIPTFIWRFGFNKGLVERTIKEYETNDGFIIVGSKLNEK